MKTIYSLLIALFVAGTAFADGSKTHQTVRMLGGTYVYLTNNYTYTATSSNLWYFSYAAGTNVYWGTTNAAGNYWPNPIQDAVLAPDANVDVNPNLACQVVIGYTNNLFAPSVYTPQVYGAFNTNVAPWIQETAAFTNTVTVTLYAVSSQEFNVADTASKSFAFTVKGTGLTPIVVSTNLPTSLLQGAYELRATVATDNISGAGGLILNGLNIVGWRP